MEQVPKFERGNATEELATKRVETPDEEMTSGRSGGVPNHEVNETAIAEARAKAEQAANSMSPAAPLEAVAEEISFPPNTPPIFSKMPEIAPFVTEYMNELNSRKEATGWAKFKNAFKAEASEELPKFKTAGEKAYAKYESLKDEPEALWDEVKELIWTKYGNEGIRSGADSILNQNPAKVNKEKKAAEARITEKKEQEAKKQ